MQKGILTATVVILILNAAARNGTNANKLHTKENILNNNFETY